MYLGTTTQGRSDQFIVLEKGDSAADISAVMKSENIRNLIVSGKEAGPHVLSNTAFSEVFSEMEIVHLSDVGFGKSEELFQFKNVKRLEIKNCKFKGKEDLDWSQLIHLEELFTSYSKRFQNLFTHPLLKTLYIEKFEEEGFEFPVNSQLETLSIEKSKDCNWASLPNLKNLKALYLVSIPSIVDITWIMEIPRLEDIDFTSCKNMENVIETISQVKSLKTIFLANTSDFKTLLPLQNLAHLQELTIESSGKLLDKKNIDFLNQMPDLEFSIEMKNCAISNEE
ncbi:hypothetical protein ACR79T_19505 [Sphingobacterium spiritivorum]|uniref:hypothetical protein n=1 Tax=Sphingobacterium spiritivorum TaxID=258 RepID=UPI003DA649D5